MRKLAFGLALAAVVGAVPRGAHAQNVFTCESHGGRRETCSVDTRGGVRLVRRLSDNPCIQGRSWGTTSRGVWVDDGCRAQFAVSNRNASRYGNNGNGRYGNGDGRYGNGGYGNGGYGNGRNGNGGYGRNDDNRGIGSRAIGLCRQAVERRVGNRRVSTWMENQGRGDARVGWRASNGASGSCRVDRNGRVDVRVDRRR